MQIEEGVMGGGGTPLYKLYRYVPPHRVGFLHRFGLKTGVHFVHFGLELGMVFEGTMGVHFQFQMSEKEGEICKFETNLRHFFCLRSNLSNTYLISA